MEQQADISMFESLQDADLCFSRMGVFQADTHIENAVFKETRQLSDAETAEVKKLEDAIQKAEREFRTKDDADLLKQRQSELEFKSVEQKLRTAQQKRIEISIKRSNAHTEFDKKKTALETPLKSFGVMVQWSEPQVDKTRIDVEV